ncbi:MAG: sugar phosphate isomerase/epimerase [Oscillospiraceae bacterium]|jgi:sugar phosphate isomerase/epimerase|nr:sugar phosphate isomerase/epimerase [Oscillospiraceae bacterium]
MNIGIRFHDTEDISFEERVANIKEQGFGCAHVALNKSFAGFAGDTAMTPGFAMYLKKVFARNEIDIAVLGCYLNLLHPDPEKLKSIQETYRAHIRFASVLGCGVVGTETGCPNPEYRYVPECHSDKCFDAFARNLAPVVEDAERFGVILGIEPVWNHSVYDAAHARRLLSILASPNVKIILDPVNLLCAINADSAQSVIDEAIELLGEDVAVLHIKDYIREGNAVRSVAAGFGQMDYTSIMRFAKREKPYIHATLENTTPDNAEKALENVRAAYAAV